MYTHIHKPIKEKDLKRKKVDDIAIIYKDIKKFEEKYAPKYVNEQSYTRDDQIILEVKNM